jgi:hypothetical protein
MACEPPTGTIPSVESHQTTGTGYVVRGREGVERYCNERRRPRSEPPDGTIPFDRVSPNNAVGNYVVRSVDE